MGVARFERKQPPRMRRANMPRPRIMNLLSDIPDYPATVVKAGAGYGKTTAVSNYLSQSGLQRRWLTLSTEDRDTSLFVRSILESILPTTTAQEDLEAVVLSSQSPVTWMASAVSAASLISHYIVEETILVLDDFQVIDEEFALISWMDAWLRDIPHHLHVVIVTRSRPTLPYLLQLMLHDDVLMIQERDLAFNEDEVAALFRLNAEHEESSLTDRQIHNLVERTGGMALVISLLLREWRNEPSLAKLKNLLVNQTTLLDSIGRLFEVGLSSTELEFFRSTSVMTTLHPNICDALLQRNDSKKILIEAEHRGHILLAAESDCYQLHPLVRDYLLCSLHPQQRKSLLDQVITWYQQNGDESRAIGYIFDIIDEPDRIQRLLPFIHTYLEKGQLSTVQTWIEGISPESYACSAQLIWAQADIDRLSNRFAQAKVGFEQCKQIAQNTCDHTMVAEALIGMIRIYLDTTQPYPAAQLIREARATVPRYLKKIRITLIQLAFENALNGGKPHRAKRLHHFLLWNGAGLPANNSDLRLLLRTGQVEAAMTHLRNRMIQHDAKKRTSLSHRETSLLFSLVCSMLGDPSTAKLEAERGRWIADSLKAPFVRAVGFIRLGHAQHLAQPLQNDALKSYETAISLMDEMDVARGKSEAFLGLCFAHGYHSKFPLAKLYAEQGISLASRVGDRWMENLVRTAYGQVCTVHNNTTQAITELTHAMQAFTECGDPFMRNAAQLWIIFAMHAQEDMRWHSELDQLLRSEFSLGRTQLLSKPTLFGMKDPQTIVPLLMAHQKTPDSEHELTTRLLELLDSNQLVRHPGYTLYVQTFGSFEVYRGFQQVTRHEWQREKARQLFQFFLTYRGSLFHKEEICDRLWDGLNPDSADRDFKVALNVLSAALEPNRTGRGTTSFIIRQGNLYGLTSHPMLYIDRDIFVQKIREAEQTRDNHRIRQLLSSALQLYKGAYLEESRYELWCDDERERLRLLYLQAATRYSQLCIESEEYDESIQTCDRILQVEPTWEEAYVDLMKVHAQLGNRTMVVQTYQLCQRALRRELDIDVSTSTTTKFQQLIKRNTFQQR